MGADRIDGSTPESYETSLKTIREGLTVAERARLDASLAVIGTSAFAKADSRAEMEAVLRADLNGKTAGEVITEADTKRRDVTNAAMDGVFKLKKQMKAQIEDMKDEPR